MALDPKREATEQLREKEEKARRDRDHHLEQERKAGNLRGEAATGANPVGGGVNVRDRDKPEPGSGMGGKG